MSVKDALAMAQNQAFAEFVASSLPSVGGRSSNSRKQAGIAYVDRVPCSSWPGARGLRPRRWRGWRPRWA
jgi:hypothetical protein